MTLDRPTLFYKSTCGPCQWMSLLAVLLSVGLIRRNPIDSEEASKLYAQYPEHRGQLVLMEPGRVTFGRRVFAAVFRVVLSAPIRLARQLVSASRGASR